MCALSTAIPISTAAEATRLSVPQTRGYVINMTRSPSQGGLELEIQRIAEAGFNLVLFPVYNNGWTLFPSETMRTAGMPAINPHFKKWDPLALATGLARQAGLTVWVYARPYHFHPRHSIAEHRLLKKHPEWRQRAHPEFQNAETRRHEQWHACPIRRDYRRFLADLICEMAVSYPVDGVVLNYDGLGVRGGALRNAPYCFCPECRVLYWERYRADMVEESAGTHLVRVRSWQLEQVQESYSYLRHRLLRTRRMMRVICRARPHWREDPAYAGPPAEGVLMDWPDLLESGAVEELAIDHDDEPCGPHLGMRLAADYAYLGDGVLFLPILAVNAMEDLREPLKAIARYPVPGFLAEFQSSFTEEEAHAIRRAYFAEPAPLPEIEPVRTAAILLSRILLSYEDQPMIRDLIHDMLRLLGRQMPLPLDFDVLQVLMQNLHGLEQHIRRGRLGEAGMHERTMRELGLARRFIRMACMDVRS